MTLEIEKQKIKLLVFIKLLRRSYGQYKLRLLILFFLSFVNGLVEGVGVSTLIPIFSLVVNRSTSSTEQDFISAFFKNFFQYFGIAFNLKSLILLVGCLLILKIIALFLVNYLTAKMVADYEAKTRIKLFLTTFQVKWPSLLKEKIGHLDQLLTTHVHAASNLLLYLSSSALIFAMFLVYTALAVSISPLVTFSAIAVGIFIFLLFKRFYQYNKILAARTEKLFKQLAHHANESLIGIKTIKSSGVEESVIKKGSEQFEELRRTNIAIAIVRLFTSILIQPLGLIFAVGAFVFLYKTSNFNFASFIVIVYAINKIFVQFEAGQTCLGCLIGMAPYLVNINNYQEQMVKNKEDFISGESFDFKKQIAIEQAGFSFSPDKKILNNISFIIKKGEIVGLIGPSGAGKTTFVDLLLRLLEPQEGKILLDDRDISTINLKEWRAKIGYVPQDAFLLNDTIENNIKFYNENLSYDDVVSAAKTAHIHDFIEKLPDRFSAMVGERGVMLSGGQRQRIVLARVLARKPEILILDEATSALDNESEMLVQEAIEGLRGKITTLIIAHRLTTVLSADKLIVLDNGRIIEQGAPRELLKQESSYFSRLYNLRASNF